KAIEYSSVSWDHPPSLPALTRQLVAREPGLRVPIARISATLQSTHSISLESPTTLGGITKWALQNQDPPRTHRIEDRRLRSAFHTQLRQQKRVVERDLLKVVIPPRSPAMPGIHVDV